MRCEKGGLKAKAVEAGEHARGCGLLAEPRGPQRPVFSALRLFDAARGDVAVYIGGCYGGINLASVPVNRRDKFLGVRVQHPNFTFSTIILPIHQGRSLLVLVQGAVRTAQMNKRAFSPGRLGSCTLDQLVGLGDIAL